MPTIETVAGGYPLYPQKPAGDRDRIVILMPTRGRPELLRQAIRSFESLASERTLIEIWVMVDDDDPITLDVIKSGSFEAGSIPIEWSVAPRPPTLSAGINALWHRATPAGIYLHATDDYVMTTPAWDRLVRRAFDIVPEDRLAVVQIDDAGRSPDELLIWAVSGEWANVTGRFMPPYFPFWFTDMWADHVSAMTGRQIRSGACSRAILEGITPTISMWNLPFWMRYYYVLHGERVREAERILTAIHGIDSAEHIAARDAMEGSARHFERLIASMLDDDRLRLIERRFSGEHRLPDERYLRAEAMARRHFATFSDVHGTNS